MTTNDGITSLCPAGRTGAAGRSGWPQRDPDRTGTGSGRAGTVAATWGAPPWSARTDHAAGTARASWGADREGTRPVRPDTALDTATGPGSPGSGLAGTAARLAGTAAGLAGRGKAGWRSRCTRARWRGPRP